MQHRKEPGAAHQSLAQDLHGLLGKYHAEGMPGIERIAILAQIIGREIAGLPGDAPFSPADVMHSVAANIASGNQVAAGKTQTPGGGLLA